MGVVPGSENGRARSAEASRADRWLALAGGEETRSDVERAFGSIVDATVLDRYALEAAIELLNTPARVIDFFSDLTMRERHDRVVAGVR
jgi:hypothetical protein